MAQGLAFPAFIRAEYDSGSGGFRDFERSAFQASDNVKRRFDADMAEIRRTVSAALTMPRNAAGGLNLDTAGMRQAAADAQAAAVATRQLAQAAEAAARSSGDLTTETRNFVAAARAEAVAAEEKARSLARNAAAYEKLQVEIDRASVSSGRFANEAQQAATANGRLAASQGALRQASIGAGQQLQDIAVSLYSGQRAGVVFAQQLPQMAFALSGLEGSTNKTANRIGQFASFLSGPWGIAVGLGVGVLATFTSGLFATDEALQNVEFSSFKLNEAQSILGGVIDLTTGKINNQNAALQGLAQAQLLVAKVQAQGRLAEARRGVTAIQDRKLILDGGFGGGINIQRRTRDGRDVISQQVLSGEITSKKAIDQLEQLRRVGRLTDDEFTAAATSVANLGLELENLKVFDSADRLLNGQATAGDRNLLVKPNRTRTPRSSGSSGADKARREAEQLNNAIAQTAESVTRLREQFGEAPRDIARADAAARELEATMKEVTAQLAGKKLTDANRKRLEETKAAIEDAQKRILPDFRQRPVTDRIADMNQELQIQRLLLSGREDEADLLSFQQDLMRQLRVQTVEQLEAELRGRNISKEKLDLMCKQFQQLRENARVQERMDRSVRSVGAKLQELDRARSSIEQSIAGLPDDARASLKGLVGNLRSQVNEIIARRLTDNLFGNLFARLEDEIKGKRPIDIATDNFVGNATRASTALIDLANTVSAASMAFRGAANDNLLGSGKLLNSVGSEVKSAVNKTLANDPTGDIVVSGDRGGKTNRSEQRQAQEALAASAKSLKELARSAAEGMFIGQTASSLVFGQKGSATGSAIGGALGKIAGDALGKSLGKLGQFAGPLGSIAGGLLGSVVGGLLKKTPRGFATIGGGADGNLAITGTGGNSNSAIKAGNQAASATIDTLAQIAQALGGTYDASRGSVSIGRSGDSWHVDTTGRGRLKKSQGGLDFDDDYEGAVRAATMDLIKDGVITGLRASTQRLLQQGKDIDSALQKALDFESVFTRLKEYRDPVGAALDTLDKEFMRLKGIFAEAGASVEEYADLEALYGLERAKAIEEASKRVTSSLQSLFDDLTIGDNGRSLRDRLSAAQGVYDPLKARVMAGDRSAYDAYAEAAQYLLEIQRQFSGSQTPYFNLLDEITQLTKQRIDAEKNIVSIAENRDSPFSSSGRATGAADNAPVVGAIQQQTQDLLRGMAALARVSGGGAVDSRGFASVPFL